MLRWELVKLGICIIVPHPTKAHQGPPRGTVLYSNDMIIFGQGCKSAAFVCDPMPNGPLLDDSAYWAASVLLAFRTVRSITGIWDRGIVQIPAPTEPANQDPTRLHIGFTLG